MAEQSSGRLSGVFSTRAELWASIVAGSLLGAWFVASFFVDSPAINAFPWISLSIGMVYGGRAAFEALAARKVDIDVLMVVGAGLAAVVGHPEEGALLLFLFVLAGALEALAEARTRREVEALHALIPSHAVVLRNGEWVDAEPTSLVPGEVVRIKPGERVPADAVVTLGRTEIDQSAMTGESVPRHVDVDAEIYSGTINLDDPIEARVVRPAAESSLQKVLKLVTTAREQREPVQRVIDRFSEPYAIGVLGVSVVVLLAWRWGLGREWADAAMTAITLLIVCSPCALVISTPTATLAAIARAARFGVLFKGGQSIEQLAAVRAVAFDKTGTLTYGRPRLESVHAVAWSDEAHLLAVAAALETQSTHPIATAILEAAKARGIAHADLREITHTTGRGMSGLLGNLPVRLGSYRHVEEIVPVCLRNRTQEVLRTIQSRGQIGVVVAQGQAPGEEPDAAGQAAVLMLGDAVRPGAREMVPRLHELGVRPVRMLTGDNAITAERVADRLGLDRFDAELLPQDKLRIVGEMKAELMARPPVGRFVRTRPHVAVIGDGVNDAPALAAADVSLAIGSIGSDAALESADIVLLSDDLSSVPWAIRFARRARATVLANLTFSITAIVIMALLTLAVSIDGRWRVPMWLGVLAHEGGTLLVVLNSLRLLAAPGPRLSVMHTRPSGKHVSFA